MSTCTVQGNRKENNRTTKAGLPTNLIRKVVCGCVPSFIRYLMETENKTKKGKRKGLHRGILKTRVLHRECCVQSLSEDMSTTGTKERTKDVSVKNRMCVI